MEKSYLLSINKKNILKKYKSNLKENEKIINAFLSYDEENYLNFKNEILLEVKNSKNTSKTQKDKLKNEKLKFINYVNLYNMPISIKDNITYKKFPTTCASRILKDYVPSYNATVVNILLSANANIIGKTNMDEFAMGSTTENSAFKITRNPLNIDYIPGGSSGGAAASVSADMVSVALGSDTGGSVRQPAALCGIYGFKPTWGAISRYGLIAFASSLDQIGILSKSIFDLTIVSNLLFKKDPYDMTSRGIEDKSKIFQIYLKSLEKFKKTGDINKIKEKSVSDNNFLNQNEIEEIKEKLLKFKTTNLKHPFKIVAFKGIENLITDSYTKEAYFEFIELLKSKSLEIEIIESPFDFELLLAIYYIIAPAEASSNLARYDSIKYGKFREKGEDLFSIVANTRAKGFNKEVIRRIFIGNFVLSAGYQDMYYKKALKARTYFKKVAEELFKNYNYILLPTTPSYLKKIGEKIENIIDIYSSDIFTVLANIIESPAISIPFKNHPITNTGIGIQLIGKRFADNQLLDFVFSIQ